MATSRYGQGSIYRNEKALYVGSVELPPTPEGRRQRRRIKAKTKTELLAKMRDATRQRDDGTLITGPVQTTGEWLDYWVTTILPGTVAASTERQYPRDRPRPAQASPRQDPTGQAAARRCRGHDAGPRGARPVHLHARTPRTILRRGLTIAERYGRVNRNVAALTHAPRHAASRSMTLSTLSRRPGCSKRPGQSKRAASGAHRGAVRLTAAEITRRPG